MSYVTDFLAIVDALPKPDQILLGCEIAKGALIEAGFEDPRCWKALEVTVSFVQREASIEQVAVAHDEVTASGEVWAPEYFNRDDPRSWPPTASASAIEAVLWAARTAIIADHPTDWPFHTVPQAVTECARNAALVAWRQAGGETAYHEAYYRFYKLAIGYAVGEPGIV